MLLGSDRDASRQLGISELDAMTERLFVEADGLPTDLPGRLAGLSLDPKRMAALACESDGRMPRGRIGQALDVAWMLAGGDEAGAIGMATLAAHLGASADALRRAWSRGGWEPPLD